MAAAVDLMLHNLPIDGRRVYLTGSGSGGAEAWKLALLLPRRFAAAATVCTPQVRDEHLPAALRGTAVRFITGVLDGVATECANRMKDALAALQPPPQVVYEMNMGSEAAGAYEARRDFYVWLLNRWRSDDPAETPASQPWLDPWSDGAKTTYFAARWLDHGEPIRCMCTGTIRGHAALLYRSYLAVTDRRVILWRRALGGQRIDSVSGLDLARGTVEVRWRDNDAVELIPADGKHPAQGFRFGQEQSAAAARRAVADLLTRCAGQ
jgi:poly(3-hydroxybutyrate) depolymerase